MSTLLQKLIIFSRNISINIPQLKAFTLLITLSLIFIFIIFKHKKLFLENKAYSSDINYPQAKNKKLPDRQLVFLLDFFGK